MNPESCETTNDQEQIMNNMIVTIYILCLTYLMCNIYKIRSDNNYYIENSENSRNDVEEDNRVDDSYSDSDYVLKRDFHEFVYDVSMKFDNLKQIEYEQGEIKTMKMNKMEKKLRKLKKKLKKNVNSFNED